MSIMGSAGTRKPQGEGMKFSPMNPNGGEFIEKSASEIDKRGKRRQGTRGLQELHRRILGQGSEKFATGGI